MTRIPKIKNVPITNHVTTNDISSCQIGYELCPPLNMVLQVYEISNN